VLTRATHENIQSLAAGINPYNPALQAWLNSTGLAPNDPRALQVLGYELTRQSTMIGFIEAFGFVTLSFLVLIPFVLLLKQTGGSSPFADASKH
jgi:DHA2 family multidrug resistance protein